MDTAIKHWHYSKNKSQMKVLALLSFSVLQFAYFLPLPILLPLFWKVMPSVISCCAFLPYSHPWALLPCYCLTQMAKLYLPNDNYRALELKASAPSPATNPPSPHKTLVSREIKQIAWHQQIGSWQNPDLLISKPKVLPVFPSSNPQPS